MPKIRSYVSLQSQVGGHPGVMTSEDGSLVIKPALPVEVSFYQTALSDPAFTPLLPYIPEFYGTLRLEGQVDKEKSVDGSIVVAESSADALKGLDKVLENLAHKFLRPNILDIKLGRILYDRAASQEKRARMEKTARETTSLTTGIRICGFQVHDIHTHVPLIVPKAYGKSLKASDLQDGIARFFPVASTGPIPVLEKEEVRGTGLPPDILLAVLAALRQDIAEIRQALSQIEMRMVGASLLMVYEADWKRAEEGLKYCFDEDDSEDGCEDEDEDSDNEEEKRPGPPFDVKLIDFAHTYLTPGEGPDEGVLFGIDTVLKLLDGRIEQVNADASS